MTLTDEQVERVILSAGPRQSSVRNMFNQVAAEKPAPKKKKEKPSED